MAEKNPNEDPEQDDEDFGLPDFEYEELEDDTDEDDDLAADDDDGFGSGNVMSDDFTEQLESELSDKSDDDDVDFGDFGDEDLDDSFDYDDKEFDVDDDDSFDFDTKEDDVEDTSLDSDDDFDNSDFDTSDFDTDSFDDDVDKEDASLFEASDSDYDDLQDFEPSEDEADLGNYRTFSSESGSGKFTRIIIVGVISFFLIAAVLLYFHSLSPDTPQSQKVVHVPNPNEKEKRPASSKAATSSTNNAQNDDSDTSPTPAVVAKEPEPKPEPEKDPSPKKQDPPKRKPVRPTGGTGELTVLTSSTGRSYVVVGSFIDEDIARDFGEELVSQGESAYILKGIDNVKFVRVAIAEFASYQDAASSLSQYQATYGSDVWALKY